MSTVIRPIAIAVLAMAPGLARAQQGADGRTSTETRRVASAAPATTPGAVAATSTARPTPPAHDSTAPTTAAPGTPSGPKAPAAMFPGAGTIKVDGLLQAWYASKSPSARSTFRLRRAELKLTGDLAPRVGWTFGIDAAKALSMTQTYTTVEGQRVVTDESINLASQITQDAMVTVRLPRRVAVDVGQFRVPLGYAGTQANAKLETVERPMFTSDRSRGGSLADVRDVGVMVRASTFGAVDWFAGVFNGSGESQNGTDRNEAKAIAGRVLVHAGVPGLQWGASGVYGGKPGADVTRRDRLGAEAQFAHGPLTVRSEYMTGTDGVAHRAGYYAQAMVRTHRVVELVVRADAWDPDTHREGTLATARTRELLGGVNVALAGSNSALQLDYAARSYRGVPTSATRQLLVNLQTAW